jgi:photosystem II stability/assembly factor-like uncharacterized protein
VATDLTFISDAEGWALGAASCQTFGRCARVFHTTDSGATWTTIGAPEAAVADGNGQLDCPNGICVRVRTIRFASPLLGYAFGTSLFHTLDGGRTWQQEPSTAPILSVAYAGLSAFRVAATDPGSGTTCFGGCHIQRAAATGGPWQEVGLIVTAAISEIYTDGPQRVYVFGFANAAGGAQNKRASVYATSDGGATWQTRSDPCPQTGFAQGAATAPVGHLFTLCEASGINLVRSDDGGRSVSAAITAPIGHEFAAASETTLVGVAWDGNVPVVKTSFDGGAHWQTTLTCPVGPVLALGYQDAHTAHVICPESTVWRTQDGGGTWMRTTSDLEDVGGVDHLGSRFSPGAESW